MRVPVRRQTVRLWRAARWARALAASSATTLLLSWPGWARAAEGVSAETRLDFYLYETTRLATSNPANRYDSVLRVPEYSFTGELRPDIVLRLGEKLQFVARPRFIAGLDLHVRPESRRETHGEVEANNVYVRSDFSAHLSAAYGLQYFQWGPAEMINASNHMFRFDAFRRTGLFANPGRELLNVSYTLGTNFSVVALLTLRSRQASSIETEQPFGQGGLVKAEYATVAGDAYVGLVAGDSERVAPWLGQYGSVQLSDGLTAYADASQSLGSDGYYPVADGGTGYRFAQTQKSGERIMLLASTGLRYEFLAGPIVALEYVYNRAGYEPATYDLAVTAAAASPRNLGTFLRPELDLRGRHYLYGSISLRDFMREAEASLSLRYLANLEDGSGSLLLYSETALSPVSVTMIILNGSYGGATGDRRMPLSASTTVAYRHSW